MMSKLYSRFALAALLGLASHEASSEILGLRPPKGSKRDLEVIRILSGSSSGKGKGKGSSSDDGTAMDPGTGTGTTTGPNMNPNNVPYCPAPTPPPTGPGVDPTPAPPTGPATSPSGKGKGKGKGSSSEDTDAGAATDGGKGKGGKGSSRRLSSGKGKGKGSSDDAGAATDGESSSGKGKGKGSSSGPPEEPAPRPAVAPATDSCPDCKLVPDPMCPESEMTIPCGYTVEDEYVTLKTSLKCVGRDDMPDFYAIKVKGPNAVLDCAGNGDNMIFTRGTFSSDFTGVILEDGATLKNCYVKGFGIGVEMEAGNNVITKSTIFGNARGVVIRDEGCHTIECSTIVGSYGDGIDIKPTGAAQIMILNTDILMSSSSGINILPGAGGSAFVGIENSNVFSTFDITDPEDGTANDGISVGHAGGRQFGPVDLAFYGIDKVVDAEGRGLNEKPPGQLATTEFDVEGYLEIEYSGADGLLIEDGAFGFVEGNGLLYSCNNGELVEGVPPVFDISLGVDAVFGDNGVVICEDLDQDAIDEGITCISACSPVREAQACTVAPTGPVVSPTPPPPTGPATSPSGKGKGKGKGSSSDDTTGGATDGSGKGKGKGSSSDGTTGGATDGSGKGKGKGSSSDGTTGGATDGSGKGSGKGSSSDGTTGGATDGSGKGKGKGSSSGTETSTGAATEAKGKGGRRTRRI